MSHPIEAYVPCRRTRKLARAYLRILELPRKTVKALGRLTQILVETSLPEYDLIRIARSERLHG